jgi:hypothetical protein
MGNSPGSRRASREDTEEFAEVLPGPRRAVSERVPPPLSEIKEVSAHSSTTGDEKSMSGVLGWRKLFNDCAWPLTRARRPLTPWPHCFRQTRPASTPVLPLSLPAKGPSALPPVGGLNLSKVTVSTPPPPLALRLPAKDLDTPLPAAAKSEEQLKGEKLEKYRFVCSQILPYLFVSGEEVATNCALLKSHGITHVVNCAGITVPNLFPQDFMYLKLNLLDSKDEDLSCFIYEVISFIEEARRRPDSRILVHCSQGVSRSVAFVIAYVMWSKKVDFLEAFREVREA